MVQTFIETTLQPLQSQILDGHIEIRKPGFQARHIPYWILSVEAPKEKPKVADPNL